MKPTNAHQLIAMARKKHAAVSDEQLCIAFMNYSGSRSSVEYSRLLHVLLRHRRRFLREQLGTTPDHVLHTIAAIRHSLPKVDADALSQ